MFALALFAVLLPSAQSASMLCVDGGADGASAQTSPVHGPAGATAVLRISAADEHSKNSHECQAEYELFVTPAGGTPASVSLLQSDDDYDRNLAVQLDGFSQDGKQIFGILDERGKHSSRILFDYQTGNASVQLIDLNKNFAHVVAPKCGTALAIIATTKTGGIVLEQNSPKQCDPDRRWLLDPVNEKVERLPRGTAILSLFRQKDEAR